MAKEIKIIKLLENITVMEICGEGEFKSHIGVIYNASL